MKKTVLLFALAQAVSLSHGAIIKGPYLQDVTTGGIRVRWETDAGTDSRVDYGLTASYGEYISGTYSTPLPDSGTYLHEIPVAGLTTETTYHYKVSTAGLSSSDHTFRSAVEPTTPFRFAAYGDNRSDPTAHELIADAILASQPQFVLNSGDVVESGADYAQWRDQFFFPARDLFYDIPFYVGVGNHEGFSHWVTDFIYYPASDRWWSFDFGNAHYVILDTNSAYTSGSAQYSWLVSDLSGTSKEWVFACFHHPPYSSGGHGGEPDVQSYLVPLFETYGVDMVFSGHDHLYERSSKAGIAYIVTGGGGAPLSDPDQTTNPYQIYAEKTYHFCTVDISGGSLQFYARDSDGTTFDELSIVHTPTPTMTPTPTSIPTEQIPTQAPTATPAPVVNLAPDKTVVSTGDTISMELSVNERISGMGNLAAYILVRTPQGAWFSFVPDGRGGFQLKRGIKHAVTASVIPPLTKTLLSQRITPSLARGNYWFAAAVFRAGEGITLGNWRSRAICSSEVTIAVR